MLRKMACFHEMEAGYLQFRNSHRHMEKAFRIAANHLRTTSNIPHSRMSAVVHQRLSVFSTIQALTYCCKLDWYVWRREPLVSIVNNIRSTYPCYSEKLTEQDNITPDDDIIPTSCFMKVRSGNAYVQLHSKKRKMLPGISVCTTCI